MVFVRFCTSPDTAAAASAAAAAAVRTVRVITILRDRGRAIGNRAADQRDTCARLGMYAATESLRVGCSRLSDMMQGLAESDQAMRRAESKGPSSSRMASTVYGRNSCLPASRLRARKN
jgi:hypothetical protein